MAGLVLILIININGLNNFVSKILETASEVTIANVLTIKFPNISAPTSTDPNHVSQWIVSERANTGLEIKGAYFDEKKTGYEYLEIFATKDISLKNGFIGDANELLSLGESAPKLASGVVIRIYTYIDENARKSITLDAYNIEATLPNGEKTSEGIFKRRVG